MVLAARAAPRVGDGGRVLSFEPLPRRYAQLVESIGLNGRRNINAFQHGLGASAQELSIFTDRVSPSMAPQAGSLDLIAPGAPLRSGDNIFCFPPAISI